MTGAFNDLQMTGGGNQRECVRHFALAAKFVFRSVDEKSRCVELGKVCRAELSGLLGRMQGVREEQQRFR